MWMEIQSDIPSESKFSRVFKELSIHQIAAKTHEQFVKEYLSDTIFFIMLVIPLRYPSRKTYKSRKKKKSKKKKRGRLKKRRD